MYKIDAIIIHMDKLCCNIWRRALFTALEDLALKRQQLSGCKIKWQWHPLLAAVQAEARAKGGICLKPKGRGRGRRRRR